MNEGNYRARGLTMMRRLSGGMLAGLVVIPVAYVACSVAKAESVPSNTVGEAAGVNSVQLGKDGVV